MYNTKDTNRSFQLALELIYTTQKASPLRTGEALYAITTLACFVIEKVAEAEGLERDKVCEKLCEGIKIGSRTCQAADCDA